MMSSTTIKSYAFLRVGRTYGGDPNETKNAQSGIANNPVRITSYPGACAVINCSAVSRWLQFENKNYSESSNLAGSISINHTVEVIYEAL